MNLSNLLQHTKHLGPRWENTSLSVDIKLESITLGSRTFIQWLWYQYRVFKQKCMYFQDRRDEFRFVNGEKQENIQQTL